MNQKAVLVLGLIFLGCGGSEPDPDSSSTRVDSAGIEVVVHPSEVLRPSPDQFERIAVIGSADGPPEAFLSNVVAGRFHADSLVVLVDRTQSEVKIFRLNGSHLRSHGRAGEGPGEYERLIGIGQCRPNGFTAFDLGWDLVHYDGQGRFVEEKMIRLDGGSPPYHLACSPSSRFAVINWSTDRLGSDGPRLGVFTDSGRVRIVDGNAVEIADLGTRIGSVRFGRPTGSGPHPAGRATLFGFSGDQLVLADGTDFGFELYNPDGVLERIVRVDVARPDQDSLMTAFVEASAAVFTNPAMKQRLRDSYAEFGLVEVPTFISELRTSPDRVLIREPSPMGLEGRWFEFDVEGNPLGFLPIPDGSELLDVQDDLILVLERDSLDVPAGVVYRRIRPQ